MPLKDTSTLSPSTSQFPHGEIDQEERVKEKSNFNVYLCASIPLLFLFILLALAVLLIILLVRPYNLLYTVEEAYVHDYSLAADNSTVTATFNVTMSVYNHNHRVSIVYDWARMFVECESQVLAYTDLVPFVQRPMNTTILRVQIHARNVTLQECTASNLKRKPSGSIKVDVLVRANFRYMAEYWFEDRRSARIICFEVRTYFPDSKAYQKVDCDVEI